MTDTQTSGRNTFVKTIARLCGKVIGIVCIGFGALIVLAGILSLGSYSEVRAVAIFTLAFGGHRYHRVVHGDAAVGVVLEKRLHFNNRENGG